MKTKITRILLFIILIPLISCTRNTRTKDNIDNKTYITNFELTHENPINDTITKIYSPKAILDSSNQTILILNNMIEIFDESEMNITIKSGIANYNKINNYISANDNVIISDNNSPANTIKTSKLNWDLNKSIINLDNEMTIEFQNTIINSTKGKYNLSTKQINLKEVFFKRTGNSYNGYTYYDIKIVADNTKWLKENNSLVFTSDDKQVETTIDIFN